MRLAVRPQTCWRRSSPNYEFRVSRKIRTSLLWVYDVFSSKDAGWQRSSSPSPDPAIAHGWWRGLRMPGTNIPGVLTAGTFYQDGKRVFWDVHNPENTVVIELKHEVQRANRRSRRPRPATMPRSGRTRDFDFPILQDILVVSRTSGSQLPSLHSKAIPHSA
jgi:hypothetical protein